MPHCHLFLRLVAEGVAVRVNITLPENTLAQIDRQAKALGLSRSRFLAKAAKEEMKEVG